MLSHVHPTSPNAAPRSSALTTLAIVAGLALIVVALLAPEVASAGTQKIAFQGYLTDDIGDPVTTDSVGVSVDASIWDAETGGVQHWSEVHPNVLISEGVFSVVLGVTESLDPRHFEGPPIYLELAIDGEPPLPRTRMHGSPFAMRSYVADYAEALATGAGVRNLNGLTDAVVLEGGTNVDITQNGNTLTFDATGGGGPDSDWTVNGNDQYSAVSGNVGIGTSDPKRKLHLHDLDLGLSGTEYSNNFNMVVESEDAAIALFSSSAGQDGSKLSFGDVTNGEIVDLWSILRKTPSGGRGLAFQFTDVGEVARFGPDGNVGIGTADPIRKLHVMTSDEGLDREDLSTNYDVVVEANDAVLGLFSDAAGQDGSTLVFGEVSGGAVANAWALRKKTTGGGGDLVFTETTGGEVMRLGKDGDIGIGTSSPAAKLDVRGNAVVQQNFTIDQPIINDSSFLRFNKTTTAADIIFNGGLTFQLEFFGNPTDVLMLSLDGATINGTTTTDVLEIIGGSDLAEPFDVHDAGAIQPGMVLCIDPNREGELRVARSAYDRTVAGIASGANGIKAGITLKQEGTVADGSVPVALSGRVYCLVDASFGAVRPGDLLTTSDTPGHAMKVTDHTRATGAIIGKAMSALESGRGHVLILVSLQ